MLRHIISIFIIFTVAAVFVACDASAKSDLRKAEKMLKEADKLNAEHWAEKEYRKAQAAFVEAMDLSRERKINEARDKATMAKDWAEEAVMWSKIRKADMDAEKAALGVYYD